MIRLQILPITPTPFDMAFFLCCFFRDCGCGKAMSFDGLSRRNRHKRSRSLQVTVSAVRLGVKLEQYMKKPVAAASASALIDERILGLGDWRGKTLAKVREIIRKADPEIVEEGKWGSPVWSHDGIVCTGETHKSCVKMTFAKGAALKDPSRLFNSSLEGNIRRAIDIHEGENVNETALKDLIRAAVTLNVHLKSKAKSKPRPRRASS